MNKIIAFLTKLRFWPFVILLTTLTLILSEFLVVLHSYLLTGDFFDKNLLIAGFFIPIINGFIGFGLVAFLIRCLNQLQDRQVEILRLHEEVQEKLKINESYQRAILDAFPFILWLKDTNGNYLATNAALAKGLGYDNQSEIIGKNDFDLFPADMANSFRADDQEVMQSLQKKELEEIIERNGELRWHETYKAPILDDDGHFIGTVGFAMDITERIATEEKLKLYASVFTFTHEGIIITDVNNNIVDVNKAFTSITSYSYDDVVGKNPKILQSGHNNTEFYAELWESLDKDGVWKGELWNRKKNGEEYVENATISIVYDDKNGIQNYISIFTDITQQYRQHQELEHHANYDVLTNLPNRMLFSDRMKQAIAQAIRNNKMIAVAYIDIDGFKAVNDTFGHNIGDKLLIVLAKKMTMLLRESDTVSRMGGDEFIALFVDIKNEDAITPFLNRLIETLSEPISIDNFPISVSASIGVAFYPQKEKLGTDQIIRQADKAMYRAKMSGKNQYVIFNTREDDIII